MDQAREVLETVFGHKDFRSVVQRAAVEAVLAGKDVFVCMPTGGGKSLTYQLPAMVLPGVTFVVSPLIALIQDQVSGLCKRSIEAATLNSTVSAAERARILRDLQSDEPRTKLVYITPEGLPALTPILRTLHALGRLSLFVVDEAHCISSWGHDFRPKYKQLGNFRVQFPKVPILAATATAKTEVQADVIQSLRLHTPAQLRLSCDRHNLVYDVIFKDHTPGRKSDWEDLKEFLRKQRNATGAMSCGIIYCHKRDDCDAMAANLSRAKFPALAYHGKLKPEERSGVQDKWINSRMPIIVATISFGMGVDKADVRWVVHWNVPTSMESYYQESGRAGRDGKISYCRLYYSVSDRDLRRFLAKKDNRASANQEHQRQVQASFETLGCRHVAIARHFGESIAPCQDRCDFCLDRDTVHRCVTKFASARERKRLTKGARLALPMVEAPMAFERPDRDSQDNSQEYGQVDKSDAREEGLSLAPGFIRSLEKNLAQVGFCIGCFNVPQKVLNVLRKRRRVDPPRAQQDCASVHHLLVEPLNHRLKGLTPKVRGKCVTNLNEAWVVNAALRPDGNMILPGCSKLEHEEFLKAATPTSYMHAMVRLCKRIKSATERGELFVLPPPKPPQNPVNENVDGLQAQATETLEEAQDVEIEAEDGNGDSNAGDEPANQTAPPAEETKPEAPKPHKPVEESRPPPISMFFMGS